MKGRFLQSLGVVFIALIITSVLSLSSWNFTIEHVDESELTYHGVGFLGGDLDPYWYGYGSLSMYLLGFVYWLVGHFHIFIGKFSNIQDYAAQLLYNGHHTSIARYLYTFFLVIGTILYVRTAKRIGVTWPFLFLLLTGFILSEEALKYANYLRVDLLVSLWVSVLLAIFVFIDKHNSLRVYLTISVISLAVVSKISALALLPVFLYVVIIHPNNIKEKIKQLLYSGIIFILITSILQPYNNIIFTIIYTMTHHVTPGEVSLIGGYDNAQFNLIDRFLSLVDILKNHISSFFLFPLLLYPFVYRLNKQIFYMVLILISCTTLPLLVSIKTIDYWFLPSFSLIRFASVLSIYAVYKYFDSPYLKHLVHLGLFIILILYCSERIPRYKQVAQEITRSNNIVESKNWIESEIIGTANILIDDLWYTNLPKIYGNKNIEEAKNISRLFIYDRYQNKFLNQVFENYYSKYIEDHYNTQKLYSVRLQSIMNKEFYLEPYDTYVLVSPNTYSTFTRDTDSIFERESSYFKRRTGYQYLFENASLVKRFNQGSGGVVEIYKINKN